MNRTVGATVSLDDPRMIAAIIDRMVPATIRGNGLGMIRAVLGVMIKADGGAKRLRDDPSGRGRALCRLLRL